VIGGNRESFLSPAFDSCEILWATDQTKVEKTISDRRLTRIAFGQQLQDDPVAEIPRHWHVGLQRDPIRASVRH